MKRKHYQSSPWLAFLGGASLVYLLLRIERLESTMATRQELIDSIAAVRAAAEAEKAEGQAAVAALDAAIVALQAKVDELSTPQDFAAEVADLESAANTIRGIFEAPVVEPPVEPPV